MEEGEFENDLTQKPRWLAAWVFFVLLGAAPEYSPECYPALS